MWAKDRQDTPLTSGSAAASTSASALASNPQSQYQRRHLTKAHDNYAEKFAFPREPKVFRVSLQCQQSGMLQFQALSLFAASPQAEKPPPARMLGFELLLALVLALVLVLILTLAPILTLPSILTPTVALLLRWH